MQNWQKCDTTGEKKRKHKNRKREFGEEMQRKQERSEIEKKIITWRKKSFNKKAEMYKRKQGLNTEYRSESRMQRNRYHD